MPGVAPLVAVAQGAVGVEPLGQVTPGLMTARVLVSGDPLVSAPPTPTADTTATAIPRISNIWPARAMRVFVTRESDIAPQSSLARRGLRAVTGMSAGLSRTRTRSDIAA